MTHASQEQDSEAGKVLIGLPVSDEFEYRSDYDAEIKENIPLINVFDIEFYTLFHQLGRCLASIAMDLSPAGYSRLHMMAEGVILDNSIEKIVVRDGVRTWSYDRHVTVQHVPELRQ
jgi:hypothetical protein